jgi:hypothetical protein
VARSRNIKPGLFQNEDLVALPFETRLLFAGLSCFADREGRLEDRPVRLKMQMFPADSVDLNAMLQQLHDAGFIFRYEVGNNKYIQIVNFAKHQNPHVKEAASTIPAPDKHGASTVLVPEEHHTSHADSLNLIPDSFQKPLSDSGEPDPLQTDFAELWKIYPKRAGSNPKPKALAAYRKRRKDKIPHEAIRSGLERYAAWCEATGKIGTETVMQASRFFGPGREWENDWGLPIILPKDRDDLWRIRAAIGLEYQYDDLKACHAEITQRLRAQPELREAAGL